MKKIFSLFLLFSYLPIVTFADVIEDREEWFGAARQGNMRFIKTMLQNGFNIDSRTEEGQTALILSSKNKHIELTRFLLVQGASTNIQSKTNGDSPLHAAARQGNPEFVLLLLQYDADIDIRNNEGNTSLSLAARNNHKKIAEILLKAGANIEVKNNRGATPLIMAAANGSMKTTQLLLAKGADPLATDNDDKNAIQQYGSGSVGDVLLGSVNATSIVFPFPEKSVNNEKLYSAIKSILVDRGWQPEEKSKSGIYANLQHDDRLFRIHIQPISNNILIEYVQGYGSNKNHFLNNIKEDLLEKLNMD